MQAVDFCLRLKTFGEQSFVFGVHRQRGVILGGKKYSIVIVTLTEKLVRTCKKQQTFSIIWRLKITHSIHSRELGPLSNKYNQMEVPVDDCQS